MKKKVKRDVTEKYIISTYLTFLLMKDSAVWRILVKTIDDNSSEDYTHERSYQDDVRILKNMNTYEKLFFPVLLNLYRRTTIRPGDDLERPKKE